MRKEAWFGLSMMAIVVALVFYILPSPSQMTNGHLGLLMLAMIVVAIMLGFPTAFTLMGLGTLFAFFAYYSVNPATALTRTLDLAGVGRLDFHAVNHNHFPCLGLAYRALAAGQAATCALNAANQVAVEAFMAGRIAFGDIPKVITPVLASLSDSRQPTKPGIGALLRVESSALAQATNAVAALADRPLRRKE